MFLKSIFNHAEFAADYRAGRITVNFDVKGAARLPSARLLLPLMILPLAGIGVALALMGWLKSRLALITVAIIVPHPIKRSAPHFH